MNIVRQQAARLISSCVLAAFCGVVHAVAPLVDGDWLQQRLGDPGVLVLDVRSAIDGAGREDYLAGHIPGAVHTDYLKDGWLSERGGVRGMLPDMDKLEVLAGNLGIDEEVHVVVVPAGGSAASYASATRVYWTLKALGHAAVSLLDGGMLMWRAGERAMQREPVTPEPRLFEAHLYPALIATRDDVKAIVSGRSVARLVDSRSPEYYSGAQRHPWAGRPGAIPGALNIPESRYVDEDSGRLLSGNALAAMWRDAGLDDGDTITYCNTGHLASLAWFAGSELLGYQRVRLYDGSMVEWSADATLPVALRWSEARVRGSDVAAASVR